MVAEAVVDKPSDLDVATVMSMGFPAPKVCLWGGGRAAKPSCPFFSRTKCHMPPGAKVDDTCKHVHGLPEVGIRLHILSVWPVVDEGKGLTTRLSTYALPVDVRAWLYLCLPAGRVTLLGRPHCWRCRTRGVPPACILGVGCTAGPGRLLHTLRLPDAGERLGDITSMMGAAGLILLARLCSMIMVLFQV